MKSEIEARHKGIERQEHPLPYSTHHWQKICAAGHGFLLEIILYFNPDSDSDLDSEKPVD